jgi:hypothetical protein
MKWDQARGLNPSKKGKTNKKIEKQKKINFY